MYKNIILTGIPRSGSTLSCNILNHYSNTLALLEPMNPSKLNIENNKSIASLEVVQFIFESRKNILDNQCVITRHKDGVVPTNPLEETMKNALREAIVEVGNIKLENDFNNDFTLIVKHNALFTSILDELVRFFPCYGIVRNPLSVLASWNTVNLPVNRGHIPAGEKFDFELSKNLKNTPDILNRQMIILEWFFSRFDKYLSIDNILKYEDIIQTNGSVFSNLSYGESLNKSLEELENRNANHLYADIDIERLYLKIINTKGSFWKFYTKKDIDLVYLKMKQ